MLAWQGLTSRVPKRPVDYFPRSFRITGRRETAPGAELRSANHDFEDDCIVADVAALDIDL